MVKRPPRQENESVKDVFVPNAAIGAVQAAREFFKMEASGGIVLMFVSALALIVANTPLNPYYDALLNDVEIILGIGGLVIEKPLLLWINDGLMAVFFFLVGLEIKREVCEGELSTRERALLPALAALGGIAAPAAIYYFLNVDFTGNMDGWAIPAATDIAFALGILALVGRHAPNSLKVFLTAVAVIDDLAAILIIAIFYTSDLNYVPLAFAIVALLGLFTLNRFRVAHIAPYILLGIILWVAVLKTGVHATLAGVATALFIPLRDPHNKRRSPVKHLEHGLHPWVAFGVLPLFGFANAGVSFKGMGWDAFIEPITIGIAAGLFLGKQIGIFGMTWLAITLGLSPKPKNANWLQLYGVALLCGIGFTMSLFIGALAFEGADKAAEVRLGVLMGSVTSAILGYMLLKASSRPENQALSLMPAMPDIFHRKK